MQRPKDLVAGSNHPPPHQMLRHSQARSSSMDFYLPAGNVSLSARRSVLGKPPNDMWEGTG
ncbi:MAG: hypothetical protein FWF18_03435 [Dehalococcoidia bacterium]|nr:hypothetical protein [Dehalococcoidia bacterium]